MDRFGNHICGLWYAHYVQGTYKRTYLPPVQLQSHTTINPVCFTTQLTQKYHNSNSESLPQVRYTFPLYDGVAVNSYTISYASKTLKGIVKQKDEAKKTYQAAVDRGETAGLLESLPAGVFGVTIGNLPANTDVVVEVTYCGELKHDAAIDGLRYMLPTSIAPRYGNYPGGVLNSNAVAKSGISITVDVDMATSAIRKVQSPSHPIAVSMGATSTIDANHAPFKPSQASATLTLGSTELADDFILQLLIDDISKPQAILETHPTIPNQRALMTTLVPKFTLEAAHPEIVFIADQSGSMSGAKNAALVSALKVFLKSLPLGVRFNICAFGNRFKFLFPKSQVYNETNLNTAISFVDSFSASYGGTEILEPIKEAFKQRLSDMPLEVMLLTDGEIWGEDTVFSFINEQIHSKKVDARVFALGIGGDVSHTLVEGVARAGNGFAQFVTQNEDTGQKVIRMLKGALYAHTEDYSLEVNYDERDSADMSDDDDFEIVEKVNDCLKIEESPDTKSPKSGVVGKVKSFFDTSADVDKPTKTEGFSSDRYAHLPSIDTPKLLQAPITIPPLFPFNRTTLYLLLGPESAQKKVASVTLRAICPEGPLELTIPVNYAEHTNVPTIHQLAARKAVQDLEEGRGWLQSAKITKGIGIKKKHESRFDELVERECVRLGEKFQVVGKWTSFVAVEEKNGDAMEVEEREEEVSEPDVAISSARRSAPGGGARAFSSKKKMSAMRYVDPNAASVQPFLSSPAGSGLFGNAGGGFGSSGGLFGSAQPGVAHSGGLSGNTNNASARNSSPFGSSSVRGGRGGGLFASNSNSGSSLFGRSNIQDSSGVGLFGQSSPVAQPQSVPSPFGGAPPITGLFGGNTQQQQNANISRGALPDTLARHPRPFPLTTAYGRDRDWTSSSGFGINTPLTHTEEPTAEHNPFASTLTEPHSASSYARAPTKLSSARFTSTAVSAPSPRAETLALDDDDLSLDLAAEADSDEDMGFGAFDVAPAGLEVEACSAPPQPAMYQQQQQQSAPMQQSFGMPPPPSGGALSGSALASAAPAPPPSRHNRTNEPARKSVGGKAPRMQLASKAARSIVPNLNERESATEPSLTEVKHDLINLQTFSGAWTWTDELRSMLGIADEKVFIAAIGNSSGEILATVVAVAWLEKFVPEQKGVWEMVVEKARGWLKGKGGDVQDMINGAKERL